MDRMSSNSRVVGYRFTPEPLSTIDISKDDLLREGAFRKLATVHGYPHEVSPAYVAEVLTEHPDSNIILDVDSENHGMMGRYHITKIYKGDYTTLESNVNQPGGPRVDGGRRKTRRVTKRVRKHCRSSRRN